MLNANHGYLAAVGVVLAAAAAWYLLQQQQQPRSSSDDAGLQQQSADEPRRKEQQQQQQQQQQQRLPGAAAADSAGAAAADKQQAPAAAAAAAPAASAHLPAMYSAMSDDFKSSGLDLGVIKALRPWFDNVDETSAAAALPWPKAYSAFDPPLPRGSVRLIVVPLGDASPSIAAAGAAATRAVAQLLPPGVKVFSNPRADYHITLTHLSHFQDARPEPLAADSGLDDAATPSEQRPGPSDWQLRREVAAAAALAAATPPFDLKLERVVLARSGTLLLLWADPSGSVAALRGALLAAFPGAPPRQPATIHSSLMRVTSLRELKPREIAALAAEADRWAEKLRGRTLRVEALWHVSEEVFSTIRGEREVLPLGGGGGGGGGSAV